MAGELFLERQEQEDKSDIGGGIMITPPIDDEDYWIFRVGLNEAQAVVGFPKFSTIGIGFAVEEADWNTNLPFLCTAEEILDWIWENAGPGVTREQALEAIEMVRQAAIEMTGTTPEKIADFQTRRAGLKTSA